MGEQLIINSSPHFRAKATTTTVMRDVLIALAPSLLAAVFYFGFRALVLAAVCVAGCMLFEYLYRRVLRLPGASGDLSAAVTGLLLALNLPSGLPLWMALIGSFVAIVVVKQLFGGLGRNIANPALVARIVLLVSFASFMTTWPTPGGMFQAGADVVAGASGVDAMAGATPLMVSDPMSKITYLDLFLGRAGGSMGETCKLALLLGGVYLVARRVITATIPLTYLATVGLLSFALGGDPLFHLLSGGLMLGAVFMATDYVTSPTTERGKFIFALGCGILTVVFRFYSSYPEGVSFAILIMNLVTPHIDNLTRIKAFGGVKK